MINLYWYKTAIIARKNLNGYILNKLYGCLLKYVILIICYIEFCQVSWTNHCWVAVYVGLFSLTGIFCHLFLSVQHVQWSPDSMNTFFGPGNP